MFKEIIFPICVLLTFSASVRSKNESNFNMSKQNGRQPKKKKTTKKNGRWLKPN